MTLIDGSWENTGVCPACGNRAISAGMCRNCGLEPEPTCAQEQEQEIVQTGYHTRMRLGTPDAVMGDV